MKPPKRIDIGEYVNHAIENEEAISNGIFWFEYDYENDLWNGERMPCLWVTSADEDIVLTTDELIDYLFDTIY